MSGMSPSGARDERRLRARRDIRFRTIGEEGVVIRQEAGEVLVVNEVGARVLALLDGRCSVDALVARLAEEFEVDAAVLRRDLAAYLEELLAGGVLEVVTSDR
jgi:hypothetical protein